MLTYSYFLKSQSLKTNGGIVSTFRITLVFLNGFNKRRHHSVQLWLCQNTCNFFVLEQLVEGIDVQRGLLPVFSVLLRSRSSNCIRHAKAIKNTVNFTAVFSALLC